MLLKPYISANNINEFVLSIEKATSTLNGLVIT